MSIENVPACNGYGKAWDKDGALCYFCSAERECEELTNKRDREQGENYNQNRTKNSQNKVIDNKFDFMSEVAGPFAGLKSEEDIEARADEMIKLIQQQKELSKGYLRAGILL